MRNGSTGGHRTHWFDKSEDSEASAGHLCPATPRHGFSDVATGPRKWLKKYEKNVQCNNCECRIAKVCHSLVFIHAPVVPKSSKLQGISILSMKIQAKSSVSKAKGWEWWLRAKSTQMNQGIRNDQNPQRQSWLCHHRHWWFRQGGGTIPGLNWIRNAVTDRMRQLLSFSGLLWLWQQESMWRFATCHWVPFFGGHGSAVWKNSMDGDSTSNADVLKQRAHGQLCVLHPGAQSC